MLSKRECDRAAARHFLKIPHVFQNKLTPLLSHLIGNGFDFVLINVEIENYAEHHADELCDGVSPPDVINVACKGKEIRHGEQSNELTSDGYKHREDGIAKGLENRGTDNGEAGKNKAYRNGA